MVWHSGPFLHCDIVWTAWPLWPQEELVKLGVVVHASNPSTGEAKAGGVSVSLSQPGLCGEFQSSQAYIVRYCLKTQNKELVKENWKRKTNP